MAKDPTLSLRRHIATHGSPVVSSKTVKIGAESYPANAKSAYKNARSQYYSISSICYLYNTRSLDHGDYIISCRSEQIEPVSYMDREKILGDLTLSFKLPETFSIRASRESPIDAKGMFQRYYKLKKLQPAGLQCILLPREEENIRSILFPNANGDIVTQGEHRYRLVQEPSEIESMDKVAAVFLDGSMWQFNDWPSGLVDRMKHIPVFFLANDGEAILPSAISAPVTILEIDDTPDCNNRIATAFWSVMGAPSYSEGAQSGGYSP
ncbi:uncharacterized protein NEMAJ01_0419 [Nematocida major]|uniref:uncharacterized protein n=1 Tax=Nematocida major TaxID=1912982 RepID=UPI002007BF45|nr:uncharacterized protein NEMAJ01_0419 [Nematocida major]KAH9385523.1 hypothetical protein NEMAJ01_0419 [Nematocida major]